MPEVAPPQIGEPRADSTARGQVSKKPVRWREGITPYLFVAPAFFLYMAFNLGPAISAFVLSFFKWNFFTPTDEFIGLQNFLVVLRDDRYWNALGHNLLFVFLAVVIPLGIALVLAVFVAELPQGRLFYRSAFFLPLIFSGVVIAFVWQEIYNPLYGLLNGVLGALGLEGLQRSWLGERGIVLLSVFIAYTWASFGHSFVILLAGIQSIDPDIYDAATVDGANFGQRVVYITIPSIRNVLTFAIQLKIMGGLVAIGGIIFVLTRGGPNYASDVMEVYVLRLIGNLELGLANAAAVINTIIVTVIVFGFIKWRERGND